MGEYPGTCFSTTWSESMLCFADFYFIFIINFLWAPYSPTHVNGGSRNLYTRGGPWLWLEKFLFWFFLVFLKLQGRPKNDKISHIFWRRPQTFCFYAPKRQNIVILKTNLVKHRWLLYTCVRFGELWPTNPWHRRVILQNLSKFADLSLYLWSGWTQVPETFTRDRR